MDSDSVRATHGKIFIYDLCSCMLYYYINTLVIAQIMDITRNDGGLGRYFVHFLVMQYYYHKQFN